MSQQSGVSRLEAENFQGERSVHWTITLTAEAQQLMHPIRYAALMTALSTLEGVFMGNLREPYEGGTDA